MNLKAELDIYNNEGEHVTASFVFESVYNRELVGLWMKDFIANIAGRSTKWRDAQLNSSFIVYEDKSEMEVEDGQEDQHEVE